MSRHEHLNEEYFISSLDSVVTKKSMLCAYALWFFFGIFGAHRFYIKNLFYAPLMQLLTSVGFFTLLFDWPAFVFFTLVGAWWLFDGVLIFWQRKDQKQ